MSSSVTVEATLKINEIFYSLQGETSTAGYPTAFIRLTGCPLRCSYCDSAYAFHKGSKITVAEILNTVSSYNPSYITVTGGEPLAQKSVHILLKNLCDLYENVSIETSGALAIDSIDSRVNIILDIKTPASGEMHKNLLSNLSRLKASDEIKFVICNKQDFVWAQQFIEENLTTIEANILFSPSHQELTLLELAEWILSANLKVRLQTQLHKHIWGDVPGK